MGLQSTESSYHLFLLPLKLHLLVFVLLTPLSSNTYDPLVICWIHSACYYIGPFFFLILFVPSPRNALYRAIPLGHSLYLSSLCSNHCGLLWSNLTLTIVYIFNMCSFNIQYAFLIIVFLLSNFLFLDIVTVWLSQLKWKFYEGRAFFPFNFSTDASPAFITVSSRY